MVDTRAGFWMQVATVALTVLVVTVRAVVGDAADHTFTAVLDAGIFPRRSCCRSSGWMLLPLLIGTWRITRREIAA